MGIYKKNILILLTAGCLFSPFLSAQQNDTLKVDLKEVVVTATKTEKELSETARSVSVITREQIQNSACGSVADLLSQQEGIYITGNGQTPGANQSIFMRGANSNQTAVLIDGVRINDASTVNNTLDLSELTLADVERIEVARGSHGTLYGSSAIGGVINIITNRNRKDGFSADLALQGGTFGNSTASGEASLLASYKTKKGIFLKGIYDRLHVNGLDATLDTVTDNTVFKHRDRDGWDKFTTGLTAGFENDKWNLNTSYRYLEMNTDLDLGAYTDDDNYTLDFTRNIASGNLIFKPDRKWKFSLSASYSGTRRIALNDSSVVDQAGNYDRTYSENNYSGKNISLDAQTNYRVKGAEIIAGYSLANEHMNQIAYYYSPFYASSSDLDSLDPVATLNSGFIQADLNGTLLSPHLGKINLIAGARLYSHTYFDSRLTYEINPSVKLGKNSLVYLSWSTGYNAPSLYQLYAPEKYYTYDSGYTTDLPRGTRSLRPETSESIEIGFKQFVSKQLQFQVSVFKTRTAQLIDYVYLWDGKVGIDTLGNDFNRDDFRGDKYLNVGRLTAQGIELSLSGRLSEKFSFAANVSHVYGKTDFSPSDIDPAETGGNHIQFFSNGLFLTQDMTVDGLVRRPSTANVQFNYSPVKKLTLTFTFQTVDSRSDVYYDSNLGPYGAQNTRLVNQYSVAGFQSSYVYNKHLAIYFRMENIFDEKYEEIIGFTTRGRGEYLKFTYSW